MSPQEVSERYSKMHQRFDHPLNVTVWHPRFIGIVGSYVVLFPFIGLLSTPTVSAVVYEGDYCRIDGAA